MTRQEMKSEKKLENELAERSFYLQINNEDKTFRLQSGAKYTWDERVGGLRRVNTQRGLRKKKRRKVRQMMFRLNNYYAKHGEPLIKPGDGGRWVFFGDPGVIK